MFRFLRSRSDDPAGHNDRLATGQGAAGQSTDSMWRCTASSATTRKKSRSEWASSRSYATPAEPRPSSAAVSGRVAR
ncbi:hypothetical protein [Micromonospora eburnea]|uniref:hypothetical protein n=1 Tax=Micromonospora eburnea TaxID=227316 RepID=UPI000B88B65B|nr:hypothetical protein [Micromonospora eburnea]